MMRKGNQKVIRVGMEHFKFVERVFVFFISSVFCFSWDFFFETFTINKQI